MSNPISVTKEVTFDCAHMLSGHAALCKNLHGHTYKVQVTVVGDQVVGGSSDSMVLDFKHLKEAISEVIIKKFDHAVIFSDEDFRNPAEEELYDWAKRHSMRHFVMLGRTTAEQMSFYFSQKIEEYLKYELDLDNIHYCVCRVYETPTSYAEVKTC